MPIIYANDAHRATEKTPTASLPAFVRDVRPLAGGRVPAGKVLRAGTRGHALPDKAAGLSLPMRMTPLHALFLAAARAA